jgi:hypothetical protein
MNSEIPICQQCPLKKDCAPGVDPFIHSLGIHEPSNINCDLTNPHPKTIAAATKVVTLTALKSPSVHPVNAEVKYASWRGAKIQKITPTNTIVWGQKYPPLGLYYAKEANNYIQSLIYVNSRGTRFIQGYEGYYHEIPHKAPINYNCARCKHWFQLKDPELIKTALNKVQRYRDGILTLTEKISVDLANFKDFLTRKNRRSVFLEDLSTINPSQISSGEHSDEDHQALMYYLLRGNEPIGICKLKQEAFKAHPLSPIFTPGNLYCTKTEINGTMQFEPKEP